VYTEGRAVVDSGQAVVTRIIFDLVAKKVSLYKPIARMGYADVVGLLSDIWKINNLITMNYMNI